MSGPNSAPNGDASLVLGPKDHCPRHALDRGKCEAATKRSLALPPTDSVCPPRVTKREYLFTRNKLHTGKTQRKRR
ncbi:hypothetical protein PP304_gp197 [Gordonia phage Phendrix]|uniref:Uncharacterized protein n=1 Tax=Gordonia phage Phendrix TaxID=2593335 RepID=A0A514U151_9CAUD|nr:hypothetical protein PP304_gp197 [Gordonia phage Phendrix]QDK02673.1 hypothetical protein SEA_PHENDRIX_148 [Gordonia phage Phendrix]